MEIQVLADWALIIWVIIGFIFAILTMSLYDKGFWKLSYLPFRIGIWLIAGSLGGLLTLGVYFDKLHKKKTGVDI